MAGTSRELAQKMFTIEADASIIITSALQVGKQALRG